MFETYINITAITMVVFVITVSITTILLLIQYYIHKKILDPTYYNTEYFSESELVVFASGFVFYLFKTIIYARAIVLPKTMRVRFKEDILTFKAYPFVYILALCTMLFIAYSGFALINFIIFSGIWTYYN